jgi:uncharacterized protein (TIGR02118 family)
MHKLVVLYPKPTDPDHFREYYRGTHLPLVAQLPGILAWRYSFDVSATGAQSPYFAIFEADFADAGALQASMQSPQGAAVAADVPNYASGGAITLTYPVTSG